MAHWMGFDSKEEWDSYEFEGGKGAYQLPKDPDVVYADYFIDWGDWLGLMLPFDEAREKTRSLGFKSQDEYVKYVLEPQQHTRQKEKPFSSLLRAMGGKRSGAKPHTRLPWQPDRYYKEAWKGWDDWLGQ